MTRKFRDLHGTSQSRLMSEMECSGLQSQQWGRKKASALAVAGLAESGADALTPHAVMLADALLAEVVLLAKLNSFCDHRPKLPIICRSLCFHRYISLCFHRTCRQRLHISMAADARAFVGWQGSRGGCSCCFVKELSCGTGLGWWQSSGSCSPGSHGCASKLSKSSKCIAYWIQASL